MGFFNLFYKVDIMHGVHMKLNYSLFITKDNSTFSVWIRHGILHEGAIIALGRFVSDCGRICGIH